MIKSHFGGGNAERLMSKITENSRQTSYKKKETLNVGNKYKDLLGHKPEEIFGI
jgi:hypothetical protein